MLKPSQLLALQIMAAAAVAAERATGCPAELSTALYSQNRVDYGVLGNARQPFGDGEAENRVSTKAVQIEPVTLAENDDVEPFAAVSDKAGASGVSALNSAGCPLTISGGIGAVYVFSLNGVILRAWSHVPEESRRVMQPLRTDNNAAAPVIRIGRVVRLVATCFHVLPGLVFARSCSSNGTSVSTVLAAGLPVVASTTFRAPKIKAGRLDWLYSAAIAFAKPHGLPFSIRRAADNFKAPIACSNEVV